MLTLYKCSFEGFKIEDTGTDMSGINRHRYHTSSILSGEHFVGEPPLFNRVLFHLRYLEQWMQTLSSRPIGYEERISSIPHVSQTFHEFQRQAVVNTSIGQLGLSLGDIRSGDQFLERIQRAHYYFDIRFARPTPLRETVYYCRLLQDLVTLGCDFPSGITGIALDHPQQSEDGSNDDKRAIFPYLQTLGNYSENDGITPSQHDMLFGLSDIGHVDGVGKWLEVGQRFLVVVNTLAANLYAPSPYPESRFFNVCTAAEAFRRIQLGKQSINLWRELDELAAQAGNVFKDLVGDMKKWKKAVLETRTNSVVHPGLRNRPSGRELMPLADSIHILVVLCLLGSGGLQTGVEESIRDSGRYLDVAKALRGSL